VTAGSPARTTRSRAASCGDDTTPSIPDSRASTAEHSTCRQRPRHADLRDGRLVDAGQHGDADDERRVRPASPRHRALSTAFIMSAPPDVDGQHPRRARRPIAEPLT
jgi:hypothetical protein